MFQNDAKCGIKLLQRFTNTALFRVARRNNESVICSRVAVLKMF